MLFGDQDDHGPVVSDFFNWCDDFYLCLNVSKTKDPSTDFRKESVQLQPTIIYNETVESFDHYKYLGMAVDSNLKFIRTCPTLLKQVSAAIALS